MTQHSLSSSSEITYQPAHNGTTKRIWTVFWVLSVITLFELACGYWIYVIHKGTNPTSGLVMFLKGVIAILTLAKAYFIVSVFMHLGDEIRNFVMTIIVPVILFVWFILAFIMDGASWRSLRNTNGHSRQDTHSQQIVVPREGTKP